MAVTGRPSGVIPSQNLSTGDVQDVLLLDVGVLELTKGGTTKSGVKGHAVLYALVQLRRNFLNLT